MKTAWDPSFINHSAQLRPHPYWASTPSGLVLKITRILIKFGYCAFLNPFKFIIETKSFFNIFRLHTNRKQQRNSEKGHVSTRQWWLNCTIWMRQIWNLIIFLDLVVWSGQSLIRTTILSQLENVDCQKLFFLENKSIFSKSISINRNDKWDTKYKKVINKILLYI